MKKLLASLALALGIVAVNVVPAYAWYSAPKYGNHSTYYNCNGPYGSYTIPKVYYRCDVDYDWFAEVFLGQDDMKQVKVAAVWIV